MKRTPSDSPAWRCACHHFAVSSVCGFKRREFETVWKAIEAAAASAPWTEAAAVVLEGLGIGRERFLAVLRGALRPAIPLEPDDHVVASDDVDYPPRLGEVAGPPRFLFMRGRIELLDGRPAIAVVGTREPSGEGRGRARKLGYLLAKRGIVVVSGLARGIDGEAHRGALAIGGDTVAVLGTPLTRVYPREHAALQAQIGAVGALVSQFHPAAEIQRHFFPMRNATMSGLCLGTVVVEASETSGALIQARQCLQQGRKLFIPQSALDDPRLTWPQRFLKQGAHRFRTIEELMEVLEQEGLVEEGSAPNDHVSTVVTLDVR